MTSNDPTNNVRQRGRATLAAIVYVVALLPACRSKHECSSSQAVAFSPRATDLVLADGAVLRGRLDVADVWIPEQARVWVDADLDLRASGLIRIDGMLVALDADALDVVDAPSIALTSALAIDIRGRVCGGTGARGTRANGGNGSSLSLSAPLVSIDGEVRAGDGGTGGVGKSGGNGGHASVMGNFHVRDAQERRPTLVSGQGGSGGSPGGDGGESGNAFAHTSEELRAQFDSLGPQIQSALARFPIVLTRD